MRRLLSWVHEPWAINAAQILQYSAAIFAGALAINGATPQFLSGNLNPTLISFVGGLWIIGGAVGSYSVIRGLWALERISLWIVGIAFFMLLPSAVFYSFNGKNPALWIILLLVIWALCDVFKRYRRIDWAYLDPSK